MWKLVSVGDGVEVAVVMAGLKALENSVLNLNNVVVALRADMSRIAREQRVLRWMNVASVFVGVVCFVAMCILLYNQV